MQKDWMEIGEKWRKWGLEYSKNFREDALERMKHIEKRREERDWKQF